MMLILSQYVLFPLRRKILEVHRYSMPNSPQKVDFALKPVYSITCPQRQMKFLRWKLKHFNSPTYLSTVDFTSGSSGISLVISILCTSNVDELSVLKLTVIQLNSLKSVPLLITWTPLILKRAKQENQPWQHILSNQWCIPLLNFSYFGSPSQLVSKTIYWGREGLPYKKWGIFFWKIWIKLLKESIWARHQL